MLFCFAAEGAACGGEQQNEQQKGNNREFEAEEKQRRGEEKSLVAIEDLVGCLPYLKLTSRVL